MAVAWKKSDGSTSRQDHPVLLTVMGFLILYDNHTFF
jgi:hypothetical protein